MTDAEKTLEFVVRTQDKKDVALSLLKNFSISIDNILPIACELHRDDLIPILIKHGKINDIDTIILCLSKTKHTQLLFNLLQYNASDLPLDLALIQASKHGLLENVKLLCSQPGINIHVNDDAPLRKASENGLHHIVSYLLEKGANIHADDDYSVRWAAYRGHAEVVKLLVSRGANWKALNSWALKFARKQNQTQVVSYLNTLN